MAQEKLSMRKLRELLRLHYELKQSNRAVARSNGVSSSTVSDYIGRSRLAKLSWPLPPELDDEEKLGALLFPAEKAPNPSRPEPEWAYIYKELKRKHVTKLLLWHEYREGCPEGYGYSQFCERYSKWFGRMSPTMRQAHVAGERLFVDFSGDGLEVVDATTGEVRVAKLFLAVLGASSYTYAEPVFSEDLPTWVSCRV